jgi:hypothetical protein
LDITASVGPPGGTVTVAARIQNASNEVLSFGFEVTFDSVVLEFAGYSRGSLVENFDFFDAFNPETGIVRVGGFEAGEDAIEAGASGDLVYINFKVRECEPGVYYTLDLQELKDDIAEWTASLGCFQCGCTCDVNHDVDITPQDAMCAFQKYLGICPTNCGPCEDICCDVTINGNCTPADPLEIFKCYLGMESLCPMEECE